LSADHIAHNRHLALHPESTFTGTRPVGPLLSALGEAPGQQPKKVVALQGPFTAPIAIDDTGNSRHAGNGPPSPASELNLKSGVSAVFYAAIANI
jgi:hypothetical protein